jgi:hypothetical protein
MLAYILAIVIGLGSFSLYMSAFFLPEVYRKYDFVWSGVGMFYALVLWVCAGRITGGVLLGQLASVSLLGWFGWQTLQLRRELTPPDQQTQLPGSATSVGEVLQDRWQSLQTSGKSGRLAPLLSGGERIIQPAVRFFTGVGEFIQGIWNTTRMPKSTPPVDMRPVSPPPSSASSSPSIEAIADAGSLLGDTERVAESIEDIFPEEWDEETEAAIAPPAPTPEPEAFSLPLNDPSELAEAPPVAELEVIQEEAIVVVNLEVDPAPSSTEADVDPATFFLEGSPEEAVAETTEGDLPIVAEADPDSEATDTDSAVPDSLEMSDPPSQPSEP